MASWRLEMRLHASVSPVSLCRTSHTVSADSAVVWLSSRTKSYSARASCAVRSRLATAAPLKAQRAVGVS